MNNSLKKRARIRLLKLKIAQIKSEYSNKISLLEEQCRQLNDVQISTDLLTDKLKKKQDQKRAEALKEIKRLGEELSEKITPLEKELEKIQQYRENVVKKSKNYTMVDTNNTKSFFKRHKILTACGIIFGIQLLAIGILFNIYKEVDYEEYDLKGLTVKEACEKARSAGWKVTKAISREGDDKTDCYNSEIIVTDYYYSTFSGTATIYFGEKKTEEQKKAECEAVGNWYRDKQCKSQEEWENQYKWAEAHAACKKYGSSSYAKTLTDCYVGSEYVGSVDGQPATPQQNADARSETIEEEKSEAQSVESSTQPEANNTTNYDDPDRIPKDEVSTGIAACQRVAKNKYGLKIKTTEFANGYTGNENYSWMYVFRGSSYDMLTCQYNWKTGYAEIMYIRL